ncbi:hypothetical protein ZOSMA_105G00200 [Zostera marina]|uniref:A20-type domain-containing protein n=1 Tax=Zostera marina TaxID=29655 RepID=A0A0K9Q4J9_ZOSMR|nr:hypothetical protein ZOSMA_105G00200 [Zostera marina]
MAEEQHRCQAMQEGHRLCANNCGCLGSPAMLNLCSKCYRDFRLKESLRCYSHFPTISDFQLGFIFLFFRVFIPHPHNDFRLLFYKYYFYKYYSNPNISFRPHSA